MLRQFINNGKFNSGFKKIQSISTSLPEIIKGRISHESLHRAIHQCQPKHIDTSWKPLSKARKFSLTHVD